MHREIVQQKIDAFLRYQVQLCLRVFRRHGLYERAAHYHIAKPVGKADQYVLRRQRNYELLIMSYECNTVFN